MLDTVEEELGKLTALKSFFLARTLEDKVSVNVKHTNTRVNAELFGVGVILWNTIGLQRLPVSGEHVARRTHAQSSVSEPVGNV